METIEVGTWKRLLDTKMTFDEAEGVIDQALKQGSRQEVLVLLRDLYVDFTSDDWNGGGSRGTLTRMKKVYEHLSPTDQELGDMGVTRQYLKSYFAHIRYV